MTPQNSTGKKPLSLWQHLSQDRDLAARHLWAVGADIRLDTVTSATWLGGARNTLRGKNILLAAHKQLPAALALLELDGIAGRIVLCPPDISAAHLPVIAAAAACDAVVWDGSFAGVAALGIAHSVVIQSQPVPAAARSTDRIETEWVLLTSGTTGEPKLVAYTAAILAAAIKPIHSSAGSNRPVWSTFYDIRRYGGLQIFLRAMLTGGSLVLSSAAEPVAGFLARAGGHGVTHMSGTPSHWRRAVMSPAAHAMAPGYVRLSGEIADQAILDALARTYPDARIAHAFASTEAGVAFDVADGRAGFPAQLTGAPGADVEMKVVDGSLHIRSPRIAIRYLGGATAPLKDADGFVDTGDIVERAGDRFLFAGRKGGVINVGGAKVYPEEVEAVLNRHPDVQVSRVMGRKSAFTGALVLAEVVVRDDAALTAGPDLEASILDAARAILPPHKVPALLRFVAALDVSPSGKLVRKNV